MGKNKLFIISSIIIMILIFTTAATCNLCGTPINIKSPEEESSTDREPGVNDQVAAPEATEVIQEETEDTDVDGDTESGEEGAPTDGEDNHPPVIDSITLFDGTEITGEFRSATREETLFEIYASDEDGDEIVFNSDSTCGEIFDMIRVDDEMAAFVWRAPDSASTCTVTVSVSDGTEETSRNIEIEVSVATALPLHGNVHTDLCGFIIKNELAYPPDYSLSSDGSIFIGDNSIRREAKGYISFDISDVWESAPATGVNVEFVNLSISNITSVNNPNDVGEYLVIKEEKYGTELVLDTFTYEGRFLAQFPTLDLINLSISNDTLIDALETAINNEEQYFQIKIGLSSSTNDDSKQDGFWIDLGEVRLGGGYISN